MVSTTRLAIMTPPEMQPAPRRRRPKRRPKTRTRRLAFEICEPRLPLAALTGLPPPVDTVAADDFPAVEAAAEVCETALRIRACDVPAADDANLGGKEPCPEVSPVEIVADERDSSEPPDWNTLDAGPEPVWLSATLDAPDPTSSEPSPPVRLAQDQPEDSTGQEPAGQREYADFFPIAGPAAVPSTSATERREWTTASIVRYPLPDGSQPGRPGAPDSRPALLGSLPWAPRSTGPLADGRVSRSTMEGIAAFVLLAAGWLRKTHRRSRTFPQDSLDPGQFDS